MDLLENKATRDQKVAAMSFLKSIPDTGTELLSIDQETSEAFVDASVNALNAFCGEPKEGQSYIVTSMTGAAFVALREMVSNKKHLGEAIELETLNKMWKSGHMFDLFLTLMFSIGYNVAKFEDEEKRDANG